MDASLSGVPVWGLVVLGVLAVVQITLDVIALLDLYRRPTSRWSSEASGSGLQSFCW
jgi:hypothetical protein